MNSRTRRLLRRFIGSACLALSLLLGSGVQVSNARDVVAIAGDHAFWEDFEGGTICQVTLENVRTIGGYVLSGDEQCMAAFELSDDPYAWFVDDVGQLVITDVTRKVLLRFEPLENGSFYARRENEGLNNLNLTRD